MGRGRPQKRSRNTTGLRNQQQLERISTPGPHLPNTEPLTNVQVAPTDDSDSHDNSHSSTPDIPEQELGLYFDSTRFIIDNENAAIESDLELEVEELSLCGDWGDEDLQENLIQMAVNDGDSPLDENWLPYGWYGLKMKKKPRISELQIIHEVVSPDCQWQSGPNITQRAPM